MDKKQPENTRRFGLNCFLESDKELCFHLGAAGCAELAERVTEMYFAEQATSLVPSSVDVQNEHSPPAGTGTELPPDTLPGSTCGFADRLCEFPQCVMMFIEWMANVNC